jgi:hypothetical protein
MPWLVSRPLHEIAGHDAVFRIDITLDCSGLVTAAVAMAAAFTDRVNSKIAAHVGVSAGDRDR